MKYCINNLEFNSKAEIKRYCHQLLNKYNVNETINREDMMFLLHLLRFHPHFKQKMGVGVVKIKKQRTIFGNYCFFLVRLDESVTDFSFNACLQKSRSVNDFLVSACRNSIISEVSSFKTRYFDEHSVDGRVFCDVLWDFFLYDDCVVHHVKPFNDLVTEWVRISGFIFVEEDFEGHGSYEMIISFKDKKKEEDFVRFHKENAVLKVLSKRGHVLFHTTNK